MSPQRFPVVIQMMLVFAAAAAFAVPASASELILAQAEDSGPALGDTEEQTRDREEAEPETAEQQKSEDSGRTQEAPEDLSESARDLYRDVQELREKVERLEREAEARETLEVSEEEEADKEEQVLEAAGRQYSLMRKGTLGLELNMNYSYNSYDVLGQQDIEYRSDHNITNTFIIESARRDNLTIDARVPFVYKYNNVGQDNSRDVTNLGDMSVGVKYQPLKTGGDWPSPILNARLSFPSGKGDYDIDPSQELSTGSGLYELSAGVSASRPFDPINAFASLNYTHRFERSSIGQNRSQGILEKVEPGDIISLNLGFGYSVSYKMALSLSWSLAYGFPTDYYFAGGDETSAGDQVYSSLGLSTAWRLSPAQTIILGVSAGLTNDDSDFSFSLRLPFEFDV